MTFTKKEKFVLAKEISYTEIGMVLLLLLLLVSSIFNVVTTIYKKDVIEYSLKREETEEIEIQNGEYVFSLVPVTKNLNKYIIFIQKEIGSEVNGQIAYEIIDSETNEVLCSGETNVDDFRKNKMIELNLSDYEMESNKEYSLKLYSKIIGSIFVTVDKDNQLYHKQVCKNTYQNWYLFTVIVVSAIFISLFFLLRRTKKYLHCFMILAVLIGMVAIIIVPPYTAPDELRHFARAYTISEGVIVCKTYGGGAKYYYQEIPECDIDKEIVDLKLISTSSGEQWESETNWTIFLPKYLENIKKEISNEKLRIPYQGAGEISPIAYLPQIVFIWIAKILQLNALGIYYMARLGNVICSTLILTLAIKQSPRYQNLFTILFFSPGLVFLRSTCSTDSFLVSLVILFIAYVIKVAESENMHFFQRKVFGKLLIILIGIALIKLPYILCGLSLLFINNDKFSTRKFKSKIRVWINHIAYIFILIIVPSIVYLLSNKWLLSYSMRGSTTSSLIVYLCAHPIKVINVILQTFFEKFTEYLTSALTYRYSQVLLIPYLVILGYFGLCQRNEEKKIEKFGFIFLGLGMWGVILAVFYSAALGYIQGVQGRYLLPILPILGIGLSSYKGTEEFEKRMYKERYYSYIVLILWIHMIVTFKSYWLG